MLRVAEQAFRSDTGRERNANEDSYFARAPVYAVADGMGGAQAGEVASRIAAETFEAGNRDDDAPEVYLRSVAERANERIHGLAEADTARSGMGTTLTAALVAGDEISFAHVGDSRAYVFRDGVLRRLTSDHSLVEELRRQGRLTEEQAEEHPQRSIITRALGPEREVEVDTMTYPARPGDVFLLCSDGLTTMVTEERIAELLDRTDDLDDAARRLVREANDAGGRDNITVVCFRLEAVAAAVAAEEGATLVGPSAEEAGLTADAVRAGARRRAERRRPAPRRRRGAIVKGLLAALVVAAVVAGAIYGARQVYFLGTDEGGRVALYRGLPYELPLGIELYDERYSSPVLTAALPAERRGSVSDHELRSRTDAVDLILDLERTAAAEESERASDREGSGKGGRSTDRQRGSKSRNQGSRERPGGGSRSR